jgi:hypothetical protein
MSRVSKISRQADDYEFERPDNLSSWLSNFAKSIAKKPTAVDSARERNAQSVNQMVNSILGNKPVYSSVEDAVNDMRERTGLDAYLKQIKADKDADNVKIASDEIASDEIASDEMTSNLPEPLAKYDSVAQDIDNFVNNTIKNSHGIGSTVPQLQYDILANFGRAGVDSKDVMNDQVVKYLSDCILEAQKNIAPKSPEPNLGKGIGRAEEDNNNDAWSGLMPQKKF